MKIPRRKLLGPFLALALAALPSLASEPGGRDTERCESLLAVAEHYARAELGADFREDLSSWITCHEGEDKGCGALASGGDIFPFGGDANCRPAVEVPSILFHEWGHGLNTLYAGVFDSDINEALADVFSAYLTESPRFGEGLYLDRERTWIRDLSDRFVYDGPTKNTYPQSLTLSGAWWEFRERLVSGLGPDQGAALATGVFFRHLAGMARSGSSTSLPENYAFARAAVFSSGVRSVPEDLREQVLCELSNAFQDHGLGESEPGCFRLSLPTRTERLLALATERPSRTALSGVPLPNPILDERTISLSFRFSGSLVQAEAVILRLDITHDFPDDLLITVISPEGVRRDLHKGMDEIPVPRVLAGARGFEGSTSAGVWRVEIRDLAKEFSGMLHGASLEISGREI